MNHTCDPCGCAPGIPKEVRKQLKGDSGRGIHSICPNSSAPWQWIITYDDGKKEIVCVPEPPDPVSIQTITAHPKDPTKWVVSYTNGKQEVVDAPGSQMLLEVRQVRFWGSFEDSKTQSFTYTVPEGVTYIRVECYGSGGASATSSAAIAVGEGQLRFGGGGGGYAEALLDVSNLLITENIPIARNVLFDPVSSGLYATVFGAGVVGVTVAAHDGARGEVTVATSPAWGDPSLVRPARGVVFDANGVVLRSSYAAGGLPSAPLLLGEGNNVVSVASSGGAGAGPLGSAAGYNDGQTPDYALVGVGAASSSGGYAAVAGEPMVLITEYIGRWPEL